MQYIKDLSLPVSGESVSYPEKVYAKQGDAGSRFLLVTVKNGNEPLVIPDGATATVNMTKPDGTSIWNTCEIQDGKVLVELTGQMLAKEGDAICDVSITDTDGSVLTTSTFKLHISPAALKEDALESTDEFTAMEAIAKALATSGNLNAALAGKKMLNFGDSLAAGDGNRHMDDEGEETGREGYAHLIAKRNGMTLVSPAKGGAAFGDISGTREQHIINQISDCDEENVAFVLIDGGANDAIHDDTITKGAVSDGYSATLDETTFCGGMESALKACLTKWPAAAVIYVCIHRIQNEKVAEYMETAKEICRKWSVPYVDMMETGLLNCYITERYNQYMTDGNHPNEAGYLAWYVPPIEAKMRDLSLGIAGTVSPDDPDDPDEPYTGTFDIPGVIPDNVQKISQYTVNGKTSVSDGAFANADGNLSVGADNIDLPELAEWDNLTAQANGSASISRQTSEVKYLKDYTWTYTEVLTNTEETVFGFGSTESLPLSTPPADDGGSVAGILLCTHLSPTAVVNLSKKSDSVIGIACKNSGVMRVRVAKADMLEAGCTEEELKTPEGFAKWAEHTNAAIVYQVASPTTEQTTLTPLTATSGVVSLSGGYKGGTMTAVAEGAE